MCNVVDDYPDSYSKMALALSSAQVAKETLVAEFGIGEDLPFNFFGWAEGQLHMVVGMERAGMRQPIQDRFEMCVGVVQAMRSHFGCDALTFVAEGFHSSKPELTKDQNLGELYGQHDPAVRECISTSHVELRPDMSPETTLVSVTYQYVTADKSAGWVIWDEVKGYTRGVGKVLRDAPFPAMMALALRSGIEDTDFDEQQRILELLNERGFNVQVFDSFDDY